jgi:hypothetical protein
MPSGLLPCEAQDTANIAKTISAGISKYMLVFAIISSCFTEGGWISLSDLRRFTEYSTSEPCDPLPDEWISHAADGWGQADLVSGGLNSNSHMQ